MNKKHNISCPSGFPEFSPAQESVRQEWLRVITQIFQSYGFLPINTPLVEREENLVAKGGNPKEIYVLKRLLDDDGDTSHSGNALRFDQTVPLALYVARHMNEISFPFKRYVIGPVFRGERAQKGRFRQFDQCDIDVIGSEKLSVVNDALMPAIIIQIFQQLNIGDFFVRINNRKILTGFFSSLGITNKTIKSVMSIVDDLDKLSREKILGNFKEAGLTVEVAEQILKFVDIAGTNNDILKQAKTLSEDGIFQEGIFEFQQLIEVLKSMGIKEKYFKIDLSIARGLDYYTGTVFETFLGSPESPNLSIGSICSGGRYDDLAGIFTGKKLPGVGISIGLTRLLSQLFEHEIIIPEGSSPTQIMIVTTDDEYLPQAMELGSELRDLGLKVDNYVETKKLGKKFDYANKLGIPLVAILGEDEIKNNEVQIKNMQTGEQKTIKWEDLSEVNAWIS